MFPSQYIKDLVTKDLQANEAAQSDKARGIVQGKVKGYAEYGRLPDNYDGSSHVITMERNGDARAVVKRSDGKTNTWVKRKGSNEWIPVARLVFQV